MLPLVLAQLEDRLRSRTEQAEVAHVTEHTARCSKNCRHARPLFDGTVGCTARRWGATEEAAAACSDAKAQSCPGFAPPLTEDELRTNFRSMTPNELGLRWPSINELLWIKRQVLAHLAPPISDAAPAPALPAANGFSQG